ncbi:MAG: DUF6089 family protein [Bacteroidales bacterium]
MKKLLWFFSFLFFTISLSGQRSADYGFFGGVSSYLGDINTGRLFYSPLPAGGLFYRYNLHPRQSIRTNLFLGGLRANSLDFNNNSTTQFPTSFSGIVGEWTAQFEFNFLPYSTQGRKWNYTPYIAGGAGVAIINTSSLTIEPVIPFSLGFKVNIHKNLGLEAEYGFRKTFYDNFDGLNDLTDPNQRPWLHNKDWYSIAGISLTWKIYNRLAGCPAFDDGEEKRKR